MNVSAKIEYACVAMLELASRFRGGELARIKDISDRHNIPSNFLVQILLQLKTAGLVSSTRGSCGGYRLNIAPDQISLADVVSAVDSKYGELLSDDGTSSPFVRELNSTWGEVASAQHEILAGVTLADILANVQVAEGNMYYI